MNDDYKKFKIETNENITGTMKLRLDKDFKKLLLASQKSGVPLTFRGDRIVDFKIKGVPKYNNNVVPDQIVIGNPSLYFDLIVGDEVFNNVPFDKIMITEDILLFKPSFFAELDFDIKFRLKRNNVSNSIDFNITIGQKSNFIKDVLNYELIKQKFANSSFELIFSEENLSLIKGNIPIEDIDENEIRFFKKVNYINEKLNLNIILEDDYVINNSDVDCANAICEFIKTKKIKINDISVSMNIFKDDLKKIIGGERKSVLLKQNHYFVNLLGNEINLGPFKVDIKEHELLNLDDVKNTYESNKDKLDYIPVAMTMKNFGNDELYLDFNI